MTVKSHSAFKPFALVETVILHVPALTAVTFPAVDTVATAVSLEVHATVLFSASAGVSVAVRFSVHPTSRESVVLFRLTPVGSWGSTGCRHWCEIWTF